MAITTLTSKGQITIPREVREALGLATGDRIEFVVGKDGAYRIVASTRDVRHLKGMIGKPPRPVSVKDMKRAVASRA